MLPTEFIAEAESLADAQPSFTFEATSGLDAKLMASNAARELYTEAAKHTESIKSRPPVEVDPELKQTAVDACTRYLEFLDKNDSLASSRFTTLHTLNLIKGDKFDADTLQFLINLYSDDYQNPQPHTITIQIEVPESFSEISKN